MGLRPCPLELCSLRSQRRICWECYMKITAAKPSEARSSAKSGTKNLKSSNPKGSLLPLCQGYEGHGASGRKWGLERILSTLQILGEICSSFFERTPPVRKCGILHHHSSAFIRWFTVSKNCQRT